MNAPSLARRCGAQAVRAVTGSLEGRAGRPEAPGFVHHSWLAFQQGKNFTNFLPAISKAALKKISGAVRSRRLHLRTGHTFAELARKINPIVRGWLQYYGTF